MPEQWFDKVSRLAASSASRRNFITVAVGSLVANILHLPELASPSAVAQPSAACDYLGALGKTIAAWDTAKTATDRDCWNAGSDSGFAACTAEFIRRTLGEGMSAMKDACPQNPGFVCVIDRPRGGGTCCPEGMRAYNGACFPECGDCTEGSASGPECEPCKQCEWCHTGVLAMLGITRGRCLPKDGSGNFLYECGTGCCRLGFVCCTDYCCDPGWHCSSGGGCSA